jgi:hypothetical protein
MSLGGRRAVLMLVAVLFWSATPSFACFSNGVTHGMDDCCIAMMQDCGPSMTSPCCQLAPGNHPSAAISEFAPEFIQQPGLLLQKAFVQSPTATGTNRLALQSHLAPEPFPGGLSVLRI